MYGGVVLGTSTTAVAAVVLPKTGANRLLTVVAAVTLVSGVAVVVTSLARMVAKRAHKA